MISYIYQTIHTLEHRPLHLEAHAEVFDTASSALFGRPFHPDTAALARQITAMLDMENAPRNRSVFVRMQLTATGDVELKPAGVSLYRGYDLRSLFPVAVTLQYELPFGDYPTSAREATAELAHAVAESRKARSVVQYNRHEEILTADNAPLFAVKGTTVCTPPSTLSVEAMLAARCIEAAGLELHVEPIPRERLTSFDEVFYFDHRGVTALSRCDGHPYMSLIAERVARQAARLTDACRKM